MLNIDDGFQRHWTVALLIVSASFFLLLTGVINGFPFVFSDTGTYLTAFRNRGYEFHIDRPIFYSAFVSANIKFLPVWAVVWSQSLLVAGAIFIVARTVFHIYNDWISFGLCALLAIVTTVPWFTGFLTPDIFTSLMIISVAVMLTAPRLVISGNLALTALLTLCVVL